MMSTAKVAVIIPAFNEARRIAAVLTAVTAAKVVNEIVVVSDGSTDDTAEVASYFGVRVEKLPFNTGKGGAMVHGALCAKEADIVVFLDADLIGLKAEHVESLVLPVLTGHCVMSVGQFVGGRGVTDLAQQLVTCISGQRAIRRDLFLSIPAVDGVGYGVETLITLHINSRRLPTEVVKLPGVTHPMKEEKHGFIRGAVARGHMYWQMAKLWKMYHFAEAPASESSSDSVEPSHNGNIVVSNGSSQDQTIDSIQNATVSR
jgi:polyisoprenyl-phosphate glycosyltransferase